MINEVKEHACDRARTSRCTRVLVSITLAPDDLSIVRMKRSHRML
jgi:hypothetical protein